MNRPFAALPFLLFACVAPSTSCFAAPDEKATRLVPIGDLDLSSAGGMRILRRRIEGAANAVCLDVTGPSPAGRVDSTCKADALKDAHQQLSVAIAERRTGRLAYLRIIGGRAARP